MNGTVCGSAYEWLAIAALPLAAISGLLKDRIAALAGRRDD